MPPDITLRQLTYFSTLVAAGQYRRAARSLGISQPSLSLQIAALEKAVGARLLERRRSGLILTPEGRDVSEMVARILREVEALTLYASPMRDNMTGTLRLGSTPTIGPYLLPRVLRQLHRQYPRLKLAIRDGAPRDLVEDLAAGRYDLILTQLPVGRDDIRVAPLFREPLELAVDPAHRLAGVPQVRQADLAGETMLGLSPGYALHGQVQGLCETAGARLSTEFEGTSLDALRQMVSLGMGITLLPALYVASEVRATGADVTTRPLRPAMHRTVGLAWRTATGTPPAIDRFIQLTRQVIHDEMSGILQPVR
ncbi:hydrogen peroxide-inducible genes activator [Ruegeria pomeroyi]|uniref:Hydrogen peroxide-inducible genes activator n=1 Tax=Ruegeria pomeroyi TaxID=89184 RepID=A0A9Q3WHQ0_9RHOB|nr:hydrogen peroxide-inducible genes activator [Ruegeria pomeroyi]MCE8536186.1 hydrogen peroxide-inducible genes activator [Ruegeria pomeroyi]MCE8546112.1 hydrogen peroxide-inducible genes activator [Ruegeria pomeroyi]MCE8554453.1 hydrogen peroxide-inducible genes activator [Ruegeria pomeroyi]